MTKWSVSFTYFSRKTSNVSELFTLSDLRIGSKVGVGWVFSPYRHGHPCLYSIRTQNWQVLKNLSIMGPHTVQKCFFVDNFRSPQREFHFDHFWTVINTKSAEIDLLRIKQFLYSLEFKNHWNLIIHDLWFGKLKNSI